MNILTQFIFPCLWAGLACVGFSILFNIHGFGLIICCAGGSLGWLVYLISAALIGDDIFSAFIAGVFISLWSEIMARIRKCPVTGYLLVAFFPLVPGGGIYYAMEHAISGEVDLFVDTLLHTLGFCGALAVGVLLISSMVRIWNTVQQRRRAGKP